MVQMMLCGNVDISNLNKESCSHKFTSIMARLKELQYSDSLIIFIESMLSFEENQRPDFVELWDAIKLKLGEARL